MDDDNSTVVPTEPAEVVTDSPVTPEEATTTDVQDVTEPSESTEETSTEESSSTEPDDKLRKYAANQGLELDSPSAIKAAQLAMKHQAAASRNYQKSSELEKAATAISDDDATITAQQTNQDPALLQRLQRVEVRENVRDFWSDPDHDRSFEPAMLEVLQTRKYLAGDIEALYATAVLKSGGVAAVKSQGGREALTKLAQNQQAAVPTGNATTTGSPKKKEFKDLSIKEMENKLGFVRR